MQAVIGAVFCVLYQIFEKLLHVRLEDIPKIDGIINLRKNQHKILQMPLLIGLLISMQVIIMQYLKNLQPILQNSREYATLFRSQSLLVGGHGVVDRFEGLKLGLGVGLDVLGQEGLG